MTGHVRRRAVLVCMGVACIMVYALWAAQVGGVIRLRAPKRAVRADEAKVDFGRVAAGSEVGHIFVLRNTSSKTVTIKKLVPSCTCTAAVLSEKRISPEGETHVEVILRTAGYMGKMNKRCQVLFEQQDVMPVALEVAAQIYSPTACFSVNRVYFDKVAAGTEVTKTISILNTEHLHEKFAVKDVKASSDLIAVVFDRCANRFTCTLNPKAPIGLVDEKIIVTMSGPDGISNVEIPVAGRVVETYEVSPPTIFLGRLKPAAEEPVEVSVTISSLKGALPDSFNPTLANGNGKLSVKSRDDKRIVCSVVLTPPAAPGFFRGEVLIDTKAADVDDAHVLRIPYSGYCAAN